MTQEEINKASWDFSEREYEIGDVDKVPLYKGFYHGAIWRINSIWHDISETPDIDKEILIMGDDGDCLILYWDKSNEKIFRSNFIKWAYIDDLLPNKEE